MALAQLIVSLLHLAAGAVVVIAPAAWYVRWVSNREGG